MQTEVTHLPTNKTVIYPSFRKAALSFLPDLITTGPTFKNGKLFKGEYKISTSNNK